MYDLLPDRVPWFVVGPLIGLLIVAFFLVTNEVMGASGAYVQTSSLLRRRTNYAKWRVWYFVGMFFGGLLITQVLRNPDGLRSGYDSMRGAFSLPVTAGLVLVGAIILGYGAGVAGGCTSGHGMCGTSQRSMASVAVTATFMATAIAVTAVLRAATGGAL